MKTIKAYVAFDGKLFKSQKECEEYEAACKAMSDLENFVEDTCYRGMDKDDVLSVLTENAKELGKILTDLAKTKK